MDNHQSKNDNNNKTSDKDLDISSIDNNNNFSKIEEIVKTIPLFEEKFALAKKQKKHN